MNSSATGSGYNNPPSGYWVRDASGRPLYWWSQERQREWELQRAREEEWQYHQQPAPLMRQQVPAYSNGPFPHPSAYPDPAYSMNYDDRRSSQIDYLREHYENIHQHHGSYYGSQYSHGNDQATGSTIEPRGRHSSRDSQSSTSRSRRRGERSSRHSGQTEWKTSHLKDRKEVPEKDYHELQPDGHGSLEREHQHKPNVGQKIQKVEGSPDHRTEDEMKVKERVATPPRRPATPFTATCESVVDEGEPKQQEPKQQLIKHEEKRVKFTTEPPKVFYQRSPSEYDDTSTIVGSPITAFPTTKSSAIESTLAYAATVEYKDDKQPRTDKRASHSVEKRASYERVSFDTDLKEPQHTSNASFVDRVRAQSTTDANLTKEKIRPADTKVDAKVDATKSRRTETPHPISISVENRNYETPRVAPQPQPRPPPRPPTAAPHPRGFRISEPSDPRPLRPVPDITRPSAPFMGDPSTQASRARPSSYQAHGRSQHEHEKRHSDQPSRSHAPTVRPSSYQPHSRSQHENRHSDQPRYRHVDDPKNPPRRHSDERDDSRRHSDDPKTHDNSRRHSDNAKKHDDSRRYSDDPRKHENPRRHRRLDLDMYLREQEKLPRHEQLKMQERRLQQQPQRGSMSSDDFEEGLLELDRTAGKVFPRMRSDESMRVADGFERFEDSTTAAFLEDQQRRMNNTQPQPVVRRHHSSLDSEEEEEQAMRTMDEKMKGGKGWLKNMQKRFLK
ncbi:hypothetical protein F4821DRAFT_260756 [Hypoxylon rubiginosum]|uniref:Uncharacterized protein n=1 Tax=Hypoxylon rubiginosum TaxID=110542 RepID=A0ACC0CYQ1_9PEZI|nr:hypothetical protein F4821DRAFT_260756 [Hypoxylon rubiginosum]